MANLAASFQSPEGGHLIEVPLHFKSKVYCPPPPPKKKKIAVPLPRLGPKALNLVPRALIIRPLCLLGFN